MIQRHTKAASAEDLDGFVDTPNIPRSPPFYTMSCHQLEANECLHCIFIAAVTEESSDLCIMF